MLCVGPTIYCFGSPQNRAAFWSQSKISAGRLILAVVGIGMNVHQESFDFDLATPATSLRSGNWPSEFRVSIYVVALLKSLEREALGLADSAAGVTIPARVEQASSWIRGRRVEVHGPQACTGVDGRAGWNTDFLLVRTRGSIWLRCTTGGIRAAEKS